MISLTCTNCQTVLEMDDAFAGGVCRCRHCGTIQTVPSNLKGRAADPSKKKAGRALYSRRGRDEAIPSSGLDQLAQAVASSGLASSRLRRGSTPPPSSRMMIGVAGGAAVLLVMGLLWAGWAFLGGSSPPPADAPVLGASSMTAPGRTTRGPLPAGQVSPSAGVSPAPQAPLPPAGASPAFCGVPISDRVVIYLLDRGSGTADLFSYLKEAAFRSAQSLGPNREFQILFWDNGSEAAFPPVAPTYATAANVEAARRALDGVHAYGQGDVAPALERAVAVNPAVILLATAKGAQLDEAFVELVMRIRQDHDIKIHTFDLGGATISPAMSGIAQRTGGEAHLISEGDLKRAARE